jgi:amino acid transporter
VAKVGDIAKRLILGRALRSERLGEQLLSKRLALPIFSSDALSSVAYAPQEILLILSLGGTAYVYLTPYLALAVALLMAIVVASYRQLVQAYPTGGGDYEVATKNLHPLAGVVVASALLIDYVMTVAVSVSAGVDNLISAAPGLNHLRVGMAIGVVVLLMSMNLRGIRESGVAFAVPTYAFIFGIGFMLITGAIRFALGTDLEAESAHYKIHPEQSNLMGLAFLFFALRAFSSGCAALTGVEAIANGVPAFKPPKSKNAARTLLLMGGLAITMFMGITLLAIASDVRLTENTCDLIGFEGNCKTDAQLTIVAQVAGAVFGGTDNVFFFFIQGATALILVLAANTAFNGFPLLGSVLAQDRWLPRQLHTRGDRLVYSNGIIMLAAVASLLIGIYSANVTKLIQLYIIGVFTSFTLGQTGMVRHWNRLLADERDSQERRRMQRSRLINAAGAAISALVLVIVVITKFTKGAYLVLIAMPILFFIMRSIYRHYSAVARELEPEQEGKHETVLPSRNHAIVLVSKIHKPTLRALAYARATRPSTIEAVTVNVDKKDTEALQQEWFEREMPVELKVLDSPYREITKPILDYVKGIRRKSPRDVVTVFIPEYVVGRWWENLLHNQSALRLKGRLLFMPGVMVTSVPWQLHSSQGREGEDAGGGPYRRPGER